MRRLVPALLALLLAVPASRAGEPPKDNEKAAKPATPQQQYKDLVQDFNKQMREFYQAYNKAKTPEERQKLLKQRRPPDQQQYAAKILKLTEEHPNSKFAPEALAWVVTHTAPGADDNAKARDILLRDHIKSKAIAQIVPRLGYQQSPENIKLLERIINENPDHQVQGQATLTLAQTLMGQHKDKEAEKLLQQTIKENPDHQMQGQATFTLAQMFVRQKRDKDAEKEFEKVVKDYADVKQFGRSLANQAKGELYEMQHLAVGMMAPNIVGEDADGKKFQLSDYKGKVVVLDFWAEW